MGRNMPAKSDLLISRGWIHAILIVRLCGFVLPGILAYRTYTDEPPIPSNVVSVTSQVLFTDRPSFLSGTQHAFRPS
jgi:nitric oxide reductase subunit B